MKAWIKDGRIHFILPAEHEPDEMGPLYDISYDDVLTLDDARMLLRSHQQNVDALEARLVRKILMEAQ